VLIKTASRRRFTGEAGLSVAMSMLEKIDAHQGAVRAAGLFLRQAPLHFFQPTKVTVMYQRILVATDGSALSKKAVASAMDLAQLCNAELIALKVVPRYPMSYFEGGMALETSDIERVEKQWADDGQAIVDAVTALGQGKGVKVKGVTAKSDLVAEAIIAAAKKHQCDLIIMASHGHKGIKRLLLGSETQHVLTHSHTPVLVLR
jgi:nucleotide-binding universal stress UspA family protein